MSATLSGTAPDRGSSRGGIQSDAPRTERSIALIRIGVIAVVIFVYVSSIGIRRSLGPAAILVLVLACLYTFVCLLLFTSDEKTPLGIRVLSLVIDVGLVTMWILATGGPHSEFWSLFLIIIVAVGLRFGVLVTVGVSAGLAGLYGVVFIAEGGVRGGQLVYRPTLLVLAGFAVGVLAYQRTVQRRQGHAVEALAESRATELGHERAEVERLRRVDLTRSEFVAVAAHEFRTPLAAIIGVLSTLRTHGASLKTQVRLELIDGAAAQAERLARLVEDLLTVSRIEDGVLRLSMGRVDPRDLVSEAARASGAGARVNVELHRVDRMICDADAVIRVLTNLLDNAVKYSPPGERVGLEVSQDDERVRFVVRDRGPGIPTGEREAIFERFRRADGSGKPGAGLGLYISRGLVQAHGGELSVGDAEGGGAEFGFWLPRRQVDGMVEIAGAEGSGVGQGPDVDVNEITVTVSGPR